MIKQYNENQIKDLALLLKNDGIICVPTDTVYGLCARINSITAYQKLTKLKDRPNNKFFSIMCADENQIKNIAIIDERAKKLIQEFMPGPITLILRKNNNIPTYINPSINSVAIRLSPTSLLRELILNTGCPLFMTSANKSGKPICASIDEIEKSFPYLDGILDGQPMFNEASTIVDCTKDKIEILRNGPVSKEDILYYLSS